VKPSALRVEVSEDVGDVSALLLRPDAARCLLVLAHGAGAGMRHTFMASIAERLARRGVATLRYQFPYLEAGRRAPNPPALLTATVRAAVDVAADVAGDLPLLAGGKSMGGRMTSLAAAADPLPGVRGIVFFGFPLHAAGRPATERGDHLRGVSVPMLFVQGTRDRLADPTLMRPLCDDLGARAELHIVEGGDHSFHTPKRAGRSDAEVLDELAAAVEGWATKLV
jgi:predicted alpha/beta-hydrolase family hydrolase